MLVYLDLHAPGQGGVSRLFRLLSVYSLLGAGGPGPACSQPGWRQPAPGAWSPPILYEALRVFRAAGSRVL